MQHGAIANLFCVGGLGAVREHLQQKRDRHAEALTLSDFRLNYIHGKKWDYSTLTFLTNYTKLKSSTNKILPLKIYKQRNEYK